MHKWFERLKLAIGWLCVGAFFVGLYFSQQRDEELNTYAHYTIGYVIGTDYVFGPSPHDVLLFEYRVGDSTYRDDISNRPRDGKDRYLVKFSTQNPSINRFYIMAPVPDSVTVAPTKGWVKPPFPISEDVFEN